MISSTSSTDRTVRPEVVSAPSAPAPRALATRSDQITTEGAAFLRSELQRQPEIRPEVVERARALVTDPNYPSPAVIKSVAQQILRAPDLSEDAS